MFYSVAISLVVVVGSTESVGLSLRELTQELLDSNRRISGRRFGVKERAARIRTFGQRYRPELSILAGIERSDAEQDPLVARRSFAGPSLNATLRGVTPVGLTWQLRDQTYHYLQDIEATSGIDESGGTTNVLVLRVSQDFMRNSWSHERARRDEVEAFHQEAIAGVTSETTDAVRNLALEYWQLFFDIRLLQLAIDAERLAQETRESTVKKKAAGFSTAVDIHRATATLASRRADVAAASEAVSNSKTQMLVTLGKPSHGRTTKLVLSGAPRLSRLVSELEVDLGAYAKEHPRVLQLRAEQVSLTRRIERLQSDAQANLAVEATLGTSLTFVQGASSPFDDLPYWFFVGARFEPRWGTPSDGAVAALLEQSGRIRFEIEREESERAIQNLTDLENLHLARELVTDRGKAVEQLEKGLSLLRRGYDAGSVSLFELLQVQEATVDARRKLLLAELRLEKSATLYLYSSAQIVERILK